VSAETKKVVHSVEEMKYDKERYIRAAAVDIMSSAGIRNIYIAERT